MDAERLDSTGGPRADELEIAVEELLISSTAFRTLMAADDPAGRLQAIVAREGRFRDPETGAGGVLLGRVATVGDKFHSDPEPRVGARIVTLLSLAGTPLRVERVLGIDPVRMAVRVDGTAFVPQGAPWIEPPADLASEIALATLDVCGAPAHANRLARAGDDVVVLGAGKAGMLAALAAAERGARLIMLESRPERLEAVRAVLPLAGAAVVDATNPLAVHDVVYDLTGGRGSALTFSCVNVARAESAAFLSTRDGGTVVYFSMSTDFARAALGAESVQRDVLMVIGNGYLPGHASYALDLVRRHPEIHGLLQTSGKGGEAN
jgi:L-erythro-3,5-diaminohexanoate dehydrogenase